MKTIHTPYGTLYYEDARNWRFTGSEEESTCGLQWARRQGFLHDQHITPLEREMMAEAEASA